MKKLITLLMMAFAVVAISCADEEDAIVNPPTPAVPKAEMTVTATSDAVIDLGANAEVLVKVAGTAVTLTGNAATDLPANIGAVVSPIIGAAQTINAQAAMDAYIVALKDVVIIKATAPAKITQIEVVDGIAVNGTGTAKLKFTVKNGTLTKTYEYTLEVLPFDAGADTSITVTAATTDVALTGANVTVALEDNDTTIVLTGKIGTDDLAAIIAGVNTDILGINPLTIAAMDKIAEIRATDAPTATIGTITSTPATDATDGRFNFVVTSGTTTKPYALKIKIVAGTEEIPAADMKVTTPADLATTIEDVTKAITDWASGGVSVNANSVAVLTGTTAAITVSDIVLAATDAEATVAASTIITAIKASVLANTKFTVAWDAGVLSSSDSVLTLTGTPTEAAGYTLPNADAFVITVTLEGVTGGATFADKWSL